MKFWPSNLLINAKEEGRGRGKGVREKGKGKREGEGVGVRRRLLDFGLRFASHVNFLPKHQSIV